MAQLNVDIKVNGKEKLDDLEQSIDKIDKKTGISIGSLAKWTAGLYAAKEAITAAWSAGLYYLRMQEDINQSIVKTKDLEDELASSFGMASASLLEYTGAYQLYRDILVEVSDFLDAIAGKEAIIAKARADHLQMEKEYQQMLLENEKIEKRKHDAKMRQLEREAQANIRHQKLLTRFEELAQKSHEAEEKAYEDKLKAIDAAVDAIYAEVDAQIKNSEVKQEAIQVTTQLTEALEQQAGASEKASKSSSSGSTYSVSAKGTIEQVNSDRQYAQFLRERGYNADSERLLKQIDRRLADLYRQALNG